MPIISSDIEMYKSSVTNSAGGTITATAITDATLNNLFSQVTAAQAEAGATEYRKIFIKNNHASLSWQNVVAWILSETTSLEDTISLGIGTADDTGGTNELVIMTANSTITVVSSGSDTRTVTLIGEDASGNRVTEALVLNGTTPVVGAQIFSRLYYAYTTAGSGVITIKQSSTGATLGTFNASNITAIWYQNVTSKDLGFKLGNLAAAASHALWFKRVVSAGADPISLNSMTIKCEGETS